MLRRHPLLLLIAVVMWTGIAQATDTAFWHAYTVDDKTYALLQFDTPALTVAEGKIKSGDNVGEVAFEAAGKFGGAARFTGANALKFTPAAPYPNSFAALEAWVKLDRLPDKEGYIISKAAVVDGNASKYDPAVDKSFGMALSVDAKGALHLQITNTFYGYTIRTSSPEGIVPVNEWVHLAAVSADYPFSKRCLYLNGKEVANKAIEWGQGLMGKEVEPSAITIGNTAKGDAGISGLVDQVRIHGNVFKYWERPDRAWTTANAKRDITTGVPFFWPDHAPAVYLPLDGTTQAAISKYPDLKISDKHVVFEDGVRNQGARGSISISAPLLASQEEGSFECWILPSKMNNLSDFNYTFLTTNSATLYIRNTGVPSGGPIGLAFYFYKPDRTINFVTDGTDTEWYPEVWHHSVITWKDTTITSYLDGQQVAQTVDTAMLDALKSLNLSPYGSDTRFDEVYIYDKALTAAEVANAYYRYRDPAKLREARFIPVKLSAWYFPSANTIYCRLAANVAKEDVGKLRLALVGADKKTYGEREISYTDAEFKIAVPDLKDGDYTLTLTRTDPTGKTGTSDTAVIKRKRFPWEGSTLGITDEVFAPFTPITGAKSTVSVVTRSYEMNNFGLWNKVVTKGRDILAGPMTVKFETAAGAGKWNTGKSTMVQAKGHAASFKAEAVADPVRVVTTSTVEFDGCMKVEMELAPGRTPAEITKLWLDIPLKNAEVPLYHTVVDSLRSNPAGNLPAGEGVIWEGGTAPRASKWLNRFCSYLWVGAEERGLAWFAENDNGWLTAKDDKTPLQELMREGDTLTLRVYLVNIPSTITQPTKLVFGLQASPTKPMPADWRTTLPGLTGGLAVVPFGGLNCSYMGPYNDDWPLADKILESRYTGKTDKAWFEAYDQQHSPPRVHGTWPWLSSVLHFAGIVANKAGKPVAMYAEEMCPPGMKPAWEYFSSEWSGAIQPENTLIFNKSYQDFGLHYMNEWMKRGVSPYWDNTYPKIAHNPRNTAAYITETGALQPCLIIWNQREYHKRVWNLLHYWRQHQKEPLEWHLHMTNTCMLPIHTFGTVDLDHELGVAKPFTPDWLRVETIGLQIGNMPQSLYAVLGEKNQLASAMPEDKRQRSEWGMRMVHEIQRSGNALDTAVFDFGYGRAGVSIHHYWAEAPAAAVNDAQVKWLVLGRPGDKQALIVLASWAETPVNVELTFNAKELGFDLAGKKLAEIGTADTLTLDDKAAVTLTLDGPYGVRVFKTAP